VVSVTGPRSGPITADLEASPDLFPALCVAAAAGSPGSRLTGLDHLRHKESDRLSVMVENLVSLGARFRGTGSALEVVESIHSRSGELRRVHAAHDHRIAMAMTVAALVAGPLELDDPACVAKSFPEFWTAWGRLVDGLFDIGPRA
jgi:3-phosphoshikimate 1-carboxyvinyltransferase